jgi:hypothetical protein
MGEIYSKNAEKDDYYEENIPYQIHPVSNHLPSKKAFEIAFGDGIIPSH